MTRTKQLLLAAVLPTFALCPPIPAGAGESGTIILAQQDNPQQQQKKQQQQQQKPPPAQQKPAPPPQAHPPAVQQPARPPQPPAAQQPVHPPQPPAAQQPAHPPQPPAAQQPHPPQPPAAQQPAHPPQPPAAQQPVHPPQPPAAQQPVHPPQPPAAQQPVHPPQPPAAQQPVHPPQPPAAQQPVHPPQPPAAQQPVHPPQPPAAQQPVQPPQPPAAQQPVQPSQPPAAQQRPGQPPAAQQPPAQPPAAQVRPAAPLGGVAPGLTVAPRNNQEMVEQRKRADEWRSGKVQDLRTQRQEAHEGGRTFIREPDRTIIQEGGHVIIRHDEGDRFGWHARDVRVEQQGRDTVTIVERPDGMRIVTFTDPEGRLLRRLRRYPDGREVIIIDNPVREYRGIGDYYVDLPEPVIGIPRERYIVDVERASEADIYAALIAPPVEPLARAYSLDEIRYSRPLLERMPSVDVDTINFEFGSWEVTPDQVGRLAFVAQAINQAIAQNPREVFLIEGHTDAVGSDVDNLSLSDRRAQSAATVLTESFQVPPENLTTQGYGKQYLKIPTDGPERRNRRVTVRRITPLLTGQQ